MSTATAQFLERPRASISPEGRRKGGRGRDRKKRSMSANSLRNLGNGKETQFKPGQSGNPGGLPGTDLAATYARRFFETHPEGISPGLGDDLKGFNAYAFGLLADRAYGKVKEHRRGEHAGTDGAPQAITIQLARPSREMVEDPEI